MQSKILPVFPLLILISSTVVFQLVVFLVVFLGVFQIYKQVVFQISTAFQNDNTQTVMFCEKKKLKILTTKFDIQVFN